MKLNNNKWFSLIETLVAMMIFSLMLSSVYAVLNTSVILSIKWKDLINATQINEQNIELLRNIRDTNDLNSKSWLDVSRYNWLLSSLGPNKKYILENNFDNSKPIKVKNVTFTYLSDEASIKSSLTELCLNAKNILTYNCSGTNKKTRYYSFVEINKLSIKKSWTDIDLDNAIKITSYFISLNKGFQEFKVETILTDWK